MTAGGGWHLVLARDSARVLPVRGHDVIVILSRCRSGACCRHFHLNGVTRHAILTSEEGDTIAVRLGGVVQYLTRARDIDVMREHFLPAEEMHTEIGDTPAIVEGFHCTAVCPATNNCTIYARRPWLCQQHGARSLCIDESCTMRVQVNPLVPYGARHV